MTKAFVAAGVSLLVDDESSPDVQWSTPVSRLLRDDFVLSDSRSTEMVTIEDILSHRTGLPEYLLVHQTACLSRLTSLVAKTTPAWASTPKYLIRPSP
jgi:CubicO group peptidase (beta-lactamase class C family)